MIRICSKLLLGTIAVAALPLAVHAQGTDDHAKVRKAASATMHEPSRASSAPIVIAAADKLMSDGEVRKVDTSAKKITIKHGELKNLDMPGMTMVFQVADPAMLAKVKAGDKIKFRADKVNGAFTVMEIEPVK